MSDRNGWGTATVVLMGMATLAATAGCGRTQSDLGGIPAAQAPTEIARTVCAKAYDCCTPTQLMGNDMAGTDEATCEQKTQKAYADQLAPVLASQDRYRSVYDGAKLDACLAHIRGTSCQELGTTNHFSGIPGCDGFVQPRVAQGGDCTYDWECQEGQCRKDPGKIDGLCKPLDAVGESCSDSKCAADLLCDSQTKICTAALADGTACLRGDQCQSGSCNGADSDGGASMGGASMMVCGPRQGGTCFYSSGCSVGGGGRPSVVSVCALLLALGLCAGRRRIKRAGDKAPQRR